MRRRWIAATAMVMLAPLGGCGGYGRANGSASFLGKTSNAAVFIQWTRSGDNVRGSLNETIVKDSSGSSSPSNASVDTHNVSFTGTASGNGITLQLNEGLGSTSSLVGTFKGSTFDLSFPGKESALTTIQFERSDINAYNEAADAIKGQTSTDTTPTDQPTTTSTAPQTNTEPAPQYPTANCDLPEKTKCRLVSPTNADLPGPPSGYDKGRGCEWSDEGPNSHGIVEVYVCKGD